MKKEIWKDIQGYEGRYQVSNLGRVKSVKNDLILKQNPARKGYLVVQLSKDGIRKTQRVNRLVANAFIPNPKNKTDVNHIDENINNNKVTNLEWVTNRENQLYGNRNRRNADKLSKPVIGINIETGEKFIFPSISSTLRFGFSPSRVSEVVNGNQNVHKGYEWEFADIELKRKLTKVLEGVGNE